MAKKFLYLLLFLLAGLKLSAQTALPDSVPILDVQSQEKQDSTSFPKDIYVGFGAGPETGISLIAPKVSYYNFQSRNNFETYYGIEGTIGMINAPWISFDALFGVKKSVFTFDSSIAVLYFPRYNDSTDSYDYYHHATFNPKIGIKIWKVWLKAGPSLFLYSDYPKEWGPFGNLFKIGSNYYNFELLINLD